VPVAANIPPPTIVSRPPFDPLVQAMPAVPSQLSQQRMSFTQPSASSSSYTTPAHTSGHAFRPFPAANYRNNGRGPMNHQSPFHFVTASRTIVQNPYSKSNVGHDCSTRPPHLISRHPPMSNSPAYFPMPDAHLSLIVVVRMAKCWPSPNRRPISSPFRKDLALQWRMYSPTRTIHHSCPSLPNETLMSTNQTSRTALLTLPLPLIQIPLAL
jgi:hypothetical protein